VSLGLVDELDRIVSMFNPGVGDKRGLAVDLNVGAGCTTFGLVEVFADEYCCISIVAFVEGKSVVETLSVSESYHIDVGRVSCNDERDAFDILKSLSTEGTAAVVEEDGRVVNIVELEVTAFLEKTLLENFLLS
jgi:hypothetical protein